MGRRAKPTNDGIFGYPGAFGKYFETAKDIPYDELHSQDYLMRMLYAYLGWVNDKERDESEGSPTFDSVIDTIREIRNLQRDHLTIQNQRSKIIIKEVILSAKKYIAEEDYPKFEKEVKAIKERMKKAEEASAKPN